MKFLIVFCFAPFFSSVTCARVLDQIAAVVDDTVVSLSELKRIKQTYKERQAFAPLIFKKADPSLYDIALIVTDLLLIKKSLAAEGITISDDAVESRLKQLEKKLGYQRSDLIKYLDTQKTIFPEYTELTRQTMEYSAHNEKHIRESISISDQELKNHFFATHPQSETFSYRYNLVDYKIPATSVPESVLPNLPSLVKAYRETNVTPQLLKDIEHITIDSINEEDLANALSSVLKTTPEGSLSRPVLFDGSYHIFFVEKKDNQDSELFKRAKASIYAELYEKKAQQVNTGWIEKERPAHHFQILIDKKTSSKTEG